MKVKTPHEIIDMVANHYNLKNRAINPDSTCAYQTEDGKTCAFGMMCINPKKLIEGKRAVYNLENLGNNILKPEFRGYSDDFYSTLQLLHDNTENWFNDGLSDIGKEKVKYLKEKYK